MKGNGNEKRSELSRARDATEPGMGRRGAFEWVPFRYSAEASARKGEGAVVGVKRSAGAGTMFFQGGISGSSLSEEGTYT